jgi:hypothetical protein
LRDNVNISDKLETEIKEAREKANIAKSEKLEKSKKSKEVLEESLSIDDLDLNIDDDGVIIE